MTTDDGTAFVIPRENSSASDGNISNMDKEKDLLAMDSNVGIMILVNSDAVEMTTESEDRAYERFSQATQSTVDTNVTPRNDNHLGIGQGQQQVVPGKIQIALKATRRLNSIPTNTHTAISTKHLNNKHGINPTLESLGVPIVNDLHTRQRRKLYNNDRSKRSSRNLSVLPRYLLGEARRTKLNIQHVMILKQQIQEITVMVSFVFQCLLVHQD